MFRKITTAVFILIVASVHSFSQKADQTFHAWAPTPPMGWNSWDCYGPTVNEAEVKANADYMSKNLKSFGWNYIVVDIRWFVANDKAHGYNEQNAVYSIDEWGRFTPAVERFPSAAGGKGFKPLADYLHAKGLKFGIHIMRGVPVEAVKRSLPILGTKVTAKDIYSEKDQCQWLHDMYTIVKGKPGAQEYYNSIFKLYASWGLDFVKVDDLTSPYHADEVEMIRKAIDLAGRKMVLSTSPGETPVNEAQHVMKYANMWRTVGDFWDSWKQLKEHFDVFKRWNQYRAYGAYPDGDMLPLGHIGIRAERGNDRMSAFTRDEQYTLMTLWSIFRSPLMFGGDLPGNDAFTLSLLTNKSVINILNNSTNNKELFNLNDKVAWTADDAKTGDKYVALFNTADPVTIVEDRAVWKSKTVSSNNKMVDINVDLKGAKKLYLAVSDAGDDIAWDYADWLAPKLYNDHDSISLTALKWSSASAGWGKVRNNKNVAGDSIIVGGKMYHNGIGAHSNSVIEYNVPDGYTHFKATGAIDDAGARQNAGATVNFMIFTTDPAGTIPPDSSSISLKLKDLGFTSPCIITNVWTGKTVGEYKDEFSPVIRRHGAGLFRVRRKL